MGKWATILGIGKKVAGHPATQATARSIGSALVHPRRTLIGLGHGAKAAVVGGGMGYLAWENLVNDKPVVRAAAEVLVGEETVDKGLELAGNAADRIADVADKTCKSMEGVEQSVSSANETLSGVSTFLRNMTGNAPAIFPSHPKRPNTSMAEANSPKMPSPDTFPLPRLPGRCWA